MQRRPCSAADFSACGILRSACGIRRQSTLRGLRWRQRECGGDPEHGGCLTPCPRGRASPPTLYESNPMTLSRRRFLHLAGGAATLSAGLQRSWAQSYPTRPVTIVVPAAPGGATDFAARLLAEGLIKSFGVQFVVENKGGASGNLGITAAARAAPDGHTLLLAYSGYQVANPALYPNLPWHPLRSFAPVALAIMAPHVVLTRKSLPARDTAEFVAYARQHPGKINYASSGLGSIQHIGAAQLSLLSNIKMVHVPYRGAGPAMNDLLAGTVDLFITTPPPAVGHIQAGTVNALAIASKKRHAMLPQVPTSAR